MRKTVLISLIASGLFIGCKKKEEIKPVKKEIPNIININNGMLAFNNQTEFDAYVEQLETNKNLKGSSRSKPISGFISLASYLKGTPKNDLKSTSTSDAEFERNMTNAISETVIPDEVYYNVFNVDRQVQIGKLIYQVNECGTWIYEHGQEDIYKESYSNFLTEIQKYTKVTENIYTYKGIRIADTFGYLRKGIVNLEGFYAEAGINYESSDKSPNIKSNINEESTLKSGKSAISYADASYTTSYNLSTHKAGSKTLIGKSLQGFFGINSWRDKKIDSNHRVKVKLYDYRYMLYAKAGIRIEHQYLKKYKMRKWVLFGKKVTVFSSYVKDLADKIVIGTEYLKAYTDFTVEGPSMFETKNTYIKNKSRWSNNFTKLTYEGVLKTPEDVIKNLSSECALFEAGIELFGNVYTVDDAAQAGIDAGFDWVSDQIKDGISSVIDKNYPKVALVWSNYKPNRRYITMSGITEYNRRGDVNQGNRL